MKKIIAVILCLLLPGTAWALSARECESLVADLSEAIEEYRSLAHELSDYNVVLRRDPMQSLIDDAGDVVNPAGLHPGLVVQGIARSGGFKKILVEDSFYSEGEMVGPYKILEIREDGVVASEDGQTTFVPLFAPSSAPKAKAGKRPESNTGSSAS